ncbi:tetratricopeptide repeat protein [Streptomyces sp. HC44]|uniref:Tetratricopeptide repeat protein n=1 Tax=Streptomyces scabichelini TaxID=2711217 RepID=A0A6G4VD17_9ACTN|nr:tetratricopeptide repeat protein [Streptomyces scabichelini]NGO12028.1 tetratricopeptide repeat protein [Streptomyces scabichelini]
MGLVRTLLPLPRAAARLSPRVGGPLHGAALMHCLAPGWVLLRPPSPKSRLAWAEEVVVVYQTLVDAEGPRQRHRDLLARALTLHTSALLLIGRHEQACTAMDASLAVPGAGWSPAQRAALLHVRTQALFALGRLDEAMASARKCVAAYRRLLPTRQERALGGLPGALRTYALVLGTLGRTEESVAAYEECAALLRDMSLRELGRVLPLRARVLSELTTRLGDLGRYEEALTVGRQAWEAADSVLAWTFPDIVGPLRIRLLTDLAHCHEVTGNLPTARTTADKAVAEARTLTDRDRTEGRRWLTVTLAGLADLVGELGELAEELGTRRELADLCASLAAEQPEVYDPLLAEHLERLADCHEATGERLAAVRATERSVAAYRRAADREPAAYEPQLARVLANLSLCRQDDGAFDDAVTVAREAVALTRRLAESDWPTYHALTARRLRVLGGALRRSGEHVAAVACYEESESISQDAMESAEADGQSSALAAAQSGLAVSLDEAARAHLSAGRFAEAAAELRSLLALTRRTGRTDVHARCVTAFADARAGHGDAVVRAWGQATGKGFPTFVYRLPSTGARTSPAT